MREYGSLVVLLPDFGLTILQQQYSRQPRKGMMRKLDQISYAKADDVL